MGEWADKQVLIVDCLCQARLAREAIRDACDGDYTSILLT
jgi:hypothetical protein